MIDQEFKQLICEGENISAAFIEAVKKWLADDNSRAVYLYGAGKHLPWCMQYMTNQGVAVAAILDTNKAGAFLGLPIIQYDQF